MAKRRARIQPQPLFQGGAPDWAHIYAHDVVAYIDALLERILALEAGGGSGGGDGGAGEVAIGPSDPGAAAELWFDIDAVAPAPAVWLPMTQAAYDALPVKDPQTLYVISG